MSGWLAVPINPDKWISAVIILLYTYSFSVFLWKFWRIAFSYADVLIGLSGALIYFREFVPLGVLFMVRHERDTLLF
jgi:hypothetical protein